MNSTFHSILIFLTITVLLDLTLSTNSFIPEVSNSKIKHNNNIEFLIENPNTSKIENNQSFWVSFFKSSSINFISEIADRSFIMVLYFTMVSKTINPIYIFIVASIALSLMCIFSVVVGYSIPLILSENILEYIAIVIFLAFGIYTIYEGTQMRYHNTVNKKIKIIAKKGLENVSSDDMDEDDIDHSDTHKTSENQESNELTKKQIEDNLEVNDHIQKHNDNQINQVNHITLIIEEVRINKADEQIFNNSFWPSIWKMFTLMLVSELGDLTMIYTVVIAGVFNVYGVLFGAIIANILTCLIAVVAGQFLGQYLNEKIMCFIGGTIFILFAIQLFYEKL